MAPPSVHVHAAHISTSGHDPTHRPRRAGAPRWLTLIALVLLVACGGGGGPTPPDGGPTASFETRYSGTEVTFDAGASQGAASFAWSFGDGDTASGPVVSHRYTEEGTFTARLVVTDENGATDQATRTLPVGSVAGSLEVVYGDESAGTALSRRGGASPTAAFGDAPFVPGEIVVRFSDAVRPAALDLAPAGVDLVRVRDLALPGAALYRATASPGLGPLSDVDAWALSRELLARPDVVDAHPNFVLQPRLAPNDPEYDRQWHFDAIGMEAAWDATTGAPTAGDEIVVAVLDTGILYHRTDTSRRHPDLIGQVVPGYDFVSVVTYAVDGDGRDPEPYDPGDLPGGQSSYHGTHVAGTIAAATDNAVGVAGIAWGARILPVRVLGAGGGAFSDVVDGLMWSAGLSVPGVPGNQNPARVANLSLGGDVPCGTIFQEAIDAVVDAGTTVVVAAGNEGVAADASFPANCADVIAVGATDRDGDRASYSNYGPRVDLMAPGGDEADGVFSLWRDDDRDAFDYAYAAGTSMAAPHVSGVIALMLALEPDLTPGEVRALLRFTADPLTDAECQVPDACGAGLIDAPAALAALGAAPPAEPGELAFAPGFLDFGATTVTLPLRLTNVGGGEVAWSIAEFQAAGDNPGPLPAGSVRIAEGSPTLGTLGAGASATIDVVVDRDVVSTAGVYRFDLIVEQDGAELRVPARFEVPGGDGVAPDQTLYVGTFTVGPDYEITVYGLTVYERVPDAYEVLSMGGTVRVLGWLDADQSGLPDGGDYVGEYPTSVTVPAGATLDAVDLVLEPFVDADAVRALAARRFAEAVADRE